MHDVSCFRCSPTTSGSGVLPAPTLQLLTGACGSASPSTLVTMRGESSWPHGQSCRWASGQGGVGQDAAGPKLERGWHGVAADSFEPPRPQTRPVAMRGSHHGHLARAAGGHWSWREAWGKACIESWPWLWRVSGKVVLGASVFKAAGADQTGNAPGTSRQ